MGKLKDTAIKAKLCLWCLDPEVLYDSNQRDNCRVKSGKIKGIPARWLHAKIICGFIVSTNKQTLHYLIKYQDDLKKKGLEKVLTNWCIQTDQPKILLDNVEATENVLYHRVGQCSYFSDATGRKIEYIVSLT